MSSTAALEYNTNGELTIKNRQNESTGNSLKFKTSTTELTDGKLIDIKQNNNSRLSIDEIGTGAIKIERNSNDTSDINNSSITIESNASKTNSDKDLDSFLELKPKNIKLASKTYSQGNSESVENNFIHLTYQHGNDSSILIQNNDYRLNDQNNNLENKSSGQIDLNKNQIKLLRSNPNVNDMPLSSSLIVEDNQIYFETRNKDLINSMSLHDTSGFTVDAASTDFTIKNKDFTIRTASTDVPTSTLRFECVPDDTSVPNTAQTLMEMTKSSVNINSLSIGSNNNKPIITDIASSSLSLTAGDDQILPTIGYVKSLIPNISTPSNFFLQQSVHDTTAFYIANRYGHAEDSGVYGLKVKFDGATPTVTGFTGTVESDGNIKEL